MALTEKGWKALREHAKLAPGFRVKRESDLGAIMGAAMVLPSPRSIRALWRAVQSQPRPAHALQFGGKRAKKDVVIRALQRAVPLLSPPCPSSCRWGANTAPGPSRTW